MLKEKKVFRDKDIPKKKLKIVEELVRSINESASIVIVSIKNLPAKQFQLIKKKLKGNAVIRVVKKNLISRAIDSVEKGSIKNFKKYLKEDQALIFSRLDPFELSAILSKNKSMARAKIGQVVEEDVAIEAGPTELIPGPVISELGSLGIPFAIEDGKINIQSKKIILKAGEKVNEAAASIMSKLDIKPIAVGLEPVVAYDAKEDKIYEDIKVDTEKTIEKLRDLSGRALGFAVKIVYVCKETIGFLLAKAATEGKVLEKRVNENVGIHEEDSAGEKKIDKEASAEKAEESPDIQQENKSEEEK